MESLFQSSEGIPKSTVNNSVIQQINLLSKKSKLNDKLRKSKINKNSNFTDFDLSTPCQYFKSSFARSLTLGTNEIKSLDLSVNFELEKSCSLSEETLTDDLNVSIITDSRKKTDDFIMDSKIASNTNVKMTGTNIASKNNAWLSFQQQDSRNLSEENRNLMNSSGIGASQLDVPETTPNIEAAILQTQVDTLLWQLKQAEASRKMYRAVMEEVVRFLERCHRKLDSLETNTLPRSKSTHQVYQNNSKQIYNSTTTINAPRTRSSTNIIDVNSDYTSLSKSNEDAFENSSSAITYNNFRDFTWRRSPKRIVPLQLPSMDSEKLSKEAFRLLRTAQNLLKTQEPLLSQTQESTKLRENSYIPNKKKSVLRTTTSKSSYNLDLDSAYIKFSRKINKRGSCLSLRSNTDSSVQSTSSSKNETDEDNYSTSLINKETAISSTTTEDESGFSSINSFQEIGIPTIICACASSMRSMGNLSGSDLDLNKSILILDELSDCSTDTNYLESKNSTLKASQAENTIGLPLPDHRRCCSAPVVPPRFTTISSKSPDGSAVLWV